MYFGANLLFSGIRYATTGWVPEIPGIGGAWVEANAAIYTYQAIKYLEIITGAMIFFNRFTLLGLILEMPTSVNIFWLNTFIVATPRQLFTGPQELFMNGVLLLAYSGWMYGALKPKLEPLWIWNGKQAYLHDLGGRIAPPSLPVNGAAKRQISIAALICLALTVGAYIGSTGLFYAEFREIRNRDLVAYVLPWLGMLYFMLRNNKRKDR